MRTGCARCAGTTPWPCSDRRSTPCRPHRSPSTDHDRPQWTERIRAMDVSTESATEDTRAGRRRGLRLMFVCLGLFMVYLDTTIVNVALPEIQRDLDVGVTELQWVFDSYVLTFACFLLTSGRLGDLLGRHRVFL